MENLKKLGYFLMAALSTLAALVCLGYAIWQKNIIITAGVALVIALFAIAIITSHKHTVSAEPMAAWSDSTWTRRW